MKIGFTIGKFAPLHKGHQYLIEKGIKEMDEFYVIVYETNVIDIPLEQRAKWIKELYPEVNILLAKNPPSQYGLDEESVKIQMDYLKNIIKDIPVTHFYNSEPYGKYVARDLNIEEVQVDRLREKYAISGTKIRKDVNENKEYIEEILTVSNLSEISKSFSLESMYKTVSSSKQYKANLPCIEHPASMHMEFVSGFSTI